MAVLRYGLKPATCIPNVVCGDDIETLWGNAIRDNAQNAFEVGKMVFSATGTNEGVIKKPLVGFCWNMIHNYDNDPNRQVDWVAAAAAIRFQAAYPYYHHCNQLYVGNDPYLVTVSNIYGGAVVDVNGIEGHQYRIGAFENAGYNNVQVLATVRRGKRNLTSANITANSSNIQVFELKEDDADPLGYEQHIQCWYCRENPSGSGFPPLVWKVFDDSDCPVRTYTEVDKIIPITAPTVGQTEKDYLIVSVWYGAPHYPPLAPGLPGTPGFSIPNGYWVNDTTFRNNIDSDGLLDITVNLFKTC